MMQKRLLDNIHFIFAMLVVLIYLVIMPFMLHQEYKTNEKFKDLLACEHKITESFEEVCPIQAALENTISKANWLSTFVIIFWAGIIFEQDIWPNRKKIEEFFNKFEN